MERVVVASVKPVEIHPKPRARHNAEPLQVELALIPVDRLPLPNLETWLVYRWHRIGEAAAFIRARVRVQDLVVAPTPRNAYAAMKMATASVSRGILSSGALDLVLHGEDRLARGDVECHQTISTKSRVSDGVLRNWDVFKKFTRR